MRIVIAGAGSGKTRVVVNRLMYLNKLFNNSKKYEIAITYTNKGKFLDFPENSFAVLGKRLIFKC